MVAPAWLADAVARTATRAGRPEDCATVRWECAGTNGVTVWWSVEAGRVVEVREDGDTDAQCTYSLPGKAADAVARGETDPAVLFMQGIAKTGGDTAAVLRVLPAACASARAD